MSTNNLIKAFARDVFTGWTITEAIYAWLLVVLQVLVYIWNPDSPAGFIAGVTGTICVVLVAKRKISNYVFGVIQTAIGLYLGLSVRLWGESFESAYYLIMQFIGFMAWRKHLIAGTNDEQTEQVETLKFQAKHWIYTLLSITVGTIIMGYLFDKMNGTQPYVDALTLVMAIVAQAIMNFRYREQWLFWFALNIISLVQWFTLNNMSMVALYIAFIINNAYGYYQWTKAIK